MKQFSLVYYNPDDSTDYVIESRTWLLTNELIGDPDGLTALENLNAERNTRRSVAMFIDFKKNEDRHEEIRQHLLQPR